MSVFIEYAKYYDYFYADKDYAAEATFVEQLIRRHSSSARSILDFGCGTAGHAIEFAQRGYSVDGVDISPQMVSLAQARLNSQPVDTKERVNIIRGDVSEYVSGCKYDAVVALFHVACYQTSNRALQGLFKSATAALRDSGVFIFDFWYGPAVLSERPLTRVRRVNEAGMRITRTAEPVFDVNRNIVEVTYTLNIVDEQTRHAEEFREVHAMRYLFIPELESLADSAGLELVETGRWLSGNALDIGSWLGYGIARARQ